MNEFIELFYTISAAILIYLLSLLYATCAEGRVITKKDTVYIILDNCKDYDQCNLLLAIAEIESGFNSYAVGPTNDYGLFQFTDSGLREAQFQCPTLAHIRPMDLLGKVAISTKLASCLLDRLSQLHDGNLIEMLIAYNAGTGIARRWKEGRVKLSSTTHRYVLKVLHKYHRTRGVK